MEPIYNYNLTELFEAVQLQSVFPDNKTFPDCIPKFDLKDIEAQYHTQKDTPGFKLKGFVLKNFSVPESDVSFKSVAGQPVKEHIEQLWYVLTRQPYKEETSSVIPLPYPYIVPGGRFREVYYWDSYFTMLGLEVSNRLDMMQYMVDNFSFLINRLGYIPNGNRTYYKGRSQPPFFSLMVKLFAKIKSQVTSEKESDILLSYLPQLEKEYDFWMMGADKAKEQNGASKHVVQMPDGSLLNRYWDENDTPRVEAYKEDMAVAANAADKPSVYMHLRAAAESGWDFSSRWFRDTESFSSIHTTDIIPVDLNCLLFYLEETLAEIYSFSENKRLSYAYQALKQKRKSAIQKYCWNREKGFYFDFDFVGNDQTNVATAAAAFPLFFNIATMQQAEEVAHILHQDFLKAGGIVTTTNTTGQQWDAPNGWAPLQYIVVKGLENYGMLNFSKEIAKRWVDLNIKVYNTTGKLMEKYNVVDISLEAGGGEYPAQDGFGWTNGVLLKLMSMYNFK